MITTLCNMSTLWRQIIKYMSSLPDVVDLAGSTFGCRLLSNSPDLAGLVPEFAQSYEAAH